MKRTLLILLGVCVGLVVGALASLAFNVGYGAQWVRSDDDANLLVSLLLFGFLPVFGALGGFVASRYGRPRGS
ncbi:hypothetical protein [Hydrogenophaga palleronii]|uniref:hypothetical protein n=1 Tax=Hydrogenophaga palleronii TaxID=65655 RepID=UPI000826E638|nr:hypothetical protein [Hydrogenophaga palleronii]